MSQKTHINVHHSANFADSMNEKQFNSINASHRNRWNGQTLSELGFYGGYHYLVERDGEIRQFRKEEEVGAHNNVQMMNYKAIGICFAGNFSRQELSQEQIDSGLNLIRRVQERHGISDENVKPHRHYKSTQCWGMLLPSDRIVDYLKGLSNNSNHYSKSGDKQQAFNPQSQNSEKLERNKKILRVEDFPVPDSSKFRDHRPISDWAKDAVEAAKKSKVATDWKNPSEIVGNSELEIILKNLGVLNSLEGKVTKERLITALYRLEKQKNRF